MSHFSAQKNTKARKPHLCRCCETSIAAGQTYTRVNGCYEGEWYGFAAHIDCLKVETKMNYDHGTIYGDWETLADYLRNEGRFPDVMTLPDYTYQTVVDRLSDLANRLGIEVPQ